MITFIEWLRTRPLQESQLAGFLTKLADEIARLVGDKVVVLLGRDTWPLVPLLRHRGVRTQYFLYSRLQIGDQSTKKAWLKEVPHGSYVIDTKYNGTILDDIKSFDPSIKGLLIKSSGRYPELTVDEPNKYKLVTDLENMPKLIDASTGYRGPFAAVAPERKNRNRRDLDPMMYDRKTQGKPGEVRQKNQELLRSAGLPDDVVDQYKNFSGISPRERLGHDDYLSHWQRVERERQEKKANNGS